MISNYATKPMYGLLFAGLLYITGCSQSTEIDSDYYDPSKPHAYAGEDRTLNVGTYTLFDGRGSTAGEGRSITWWEWGESEDNPDDRSLFSSSNDTTFYVSFDTVGVYTFWHRVKNDAEVYSEPDTLIVTVVPRENIIFEDPNLEIRFRSSIDLPDGEITAEHLSGIEKLHGYVIHDKIKSIAGIENCLNLLYARLNRQEIGDIEPLRDLTLLEELHLDQNDIIEDISPLANMVNLKKIMLHTNQIEDISPLKKLVNLEELWIEFNPIRDISPLFGMTKMKKLLLADAFIDDITPLAGMTKMENLWLVRCQVGDIQALENMTEMNYLKLDLNAIQDISVLANMKNLVQFMAPDNLIFDLSPLENLPNLAYLRLWNNLIEDILPLVNNEDISEGDTVDLLKNPLSEKSINEYIPQLKARGVTVYY